MSNPTSNFNWQMPTSTDLVTDLPADFEVFGQAVDTSLADLKGGTTGQVLAKASATDMDFTWVAQDDSNAIQNAIVDAKGDLITATGADTPARLAVGSNDQVLIADSTTATGLKWGTPAAGGGMTVIASGTLSGSQVSITSIPSTYVNLVLFINNPYINTGTGLLQLRINNSSSALYGRWYFQSNGSNGGDGSSQTKWNLNDGSLTNLNNTQTYVSASVTLWNYADTTSQKSMSFQVQDRAQSFNSLGGTGGTAVSNTSAISSVQIITDTNTFSGGTYTLYGVK